ncbi:MAG: putative ABC transporter ATP-binding protein YheS [Spirochaetes bacterium ADurb.Bin269]|jgi:ATP-binding cassette subfamily F protein 3|nr:MAG: putative ABC transporter ATP-binding protein YheS [Spirochaetes bacterium ADurb.Bin269]HQL31819.1 ABC-F family ATP-binding cassette domain-containing protein [Treponemataceae bacterium]
MAFVQFSRVSLAFGNRDILDSVSLNLASGTRAALAGANGSGKSTLMKVLAGTISPDGGERAIQKGTHVSYLPQSGIVHAGKTLMDEVETAFSRGRELLDRFEAIGDELASLNPDDPRTVHLVEEHHAVQTALEESGWHRRRSLAEQTLAGLGFSVSDFDRNAGEFSGGWQMRIALAKILLERPDILLLDEPTNYLDLEARNWLEQWLNDFPGGFLIVSHDRYFLDSTVTEVYELFGGQLKRYAGTYTQYEKVRAVELESLIKRYEEQQEEIEKTNDFIRRFRYNASKAAMVQDRIKRLEKMELIEIPESLKKMRFHFPPAPHTGRLVLTTDKLGKKWGDRAVIENLDLVVEKKERLVVVGRNGAGKSTLLRILAGRDADFTGTVNPGAGVLAGYFSQDNAETLTGNERIIDLLEAEAPNELIPRLRDMLAAFLFRGDDIYKQVNVLSGGEKSRLALLRLLFKPLNLLILDEPTNHLDLHSKDVLLDALNSFDGTVVFVSHDRGFIEGLATRVLELTASGPGIASRVRNFPGDYRYYMERIAREEAGLEPDGASDVKAGSAKDEPEKKSANALSREEDKRLKSERRKLEREEERLMGEIARAEDELTAAEQHLADPAVYSDGEKSRAAQLETERISALIAELSASWEAVSLQLEELK